MYSLGGITLFAAADYVRGFAQLFSGLHTPVFSHLILTRGCLQAAVVAQWLSDPTIEPMERLRRGLWEQNKSAAEWASIAGTPSDTDDATERARKENERLEAKEAKERWADLARNYGWRIRWRNDTSPQVTSGHVEKNGHSKVLTERPWMATAIDRLLLGDGQFALGRMEWNYSSAMDHVTWYALRQSILDPPATTVEDPSLAGVGTDATSVLVRAQLMLRAIRIAANSRFVLMGWDDAYWRAAATMVEHHENVLFQRCMKLRGTNQYRQRLRNLSEPGLVG
jgi:hypothetical protein